MWRAEAADPRLRANVTLLELLEPAPDWDRLRAAHEWASRMVPRMRQRVVEPALGVGAPRWVTVEELDLDRAPAPGAARPRPASMRQLLDVVGEFAAAPLDRDRPLWEALLVEGLRGRAGRLRRQDPPQHHRRAGRGAADEPAAQPHPRARPAAARAAGAARRRRRLPGRAAHRADRPMRCGPRRWALLRRGVEALGGAGRPWEAARAAVEVGAVGRPHTSRRRRRLGAAADPGRRLALRGARGAAGRAEGRREGGRRFAQRRAAGRACSAGSGATTSGWGPRWARSPSASRSACARRTTRRAATGSPARASPPRWTRPTPPSGSPPCASSCCRARHRQRRCSGRRPGRACAGWLPAPVIGALSGSLTSANDVQVSNMPGVTAPGLHRRVADRADVPVRSAARLRGDDHAALARGPVLHRHQRRLRRGHRPGGLVADLRAGLDEVVALAG